MMRCQESKVLIRALLRPLLVFPLFASVFVSFSSEQASPLFYEVLYGSQIAISTLLIIHVGIPNLRIRTPNNKNISYAAFACILISIQNFLVTGNPFYSSIIAISFYVGLAVYLAVKNLEDLARSTLRLLILCNVTAILIQMIIHFSTGELHYIHDIIFPFSRDRYYLLVGESLNRNNGFQLEPGSYANIMILMLICYNTTTKRIYDKTTVVGSLSILLTLSTVGFIFVFLYYLPLILKVRFKIDSAVKITLAASLLFFSLGKPITDIIEERYLSSAEGDPSLGYKLGNLTHYLNMPIDQKVLGLGITKSPQDTQLIHLKGNGVAFFFILSHGLIGLALIMAAIPKLSKHGVIPLVFFSILLSCRYPAIFPVFWAALLSILSFSNQELSKLEKINET